MKRQLVISIFLVAAMGPVSISVSQNLLANPNFDSSVAGWREDVGFSQLTWNPFDHHSNADSGSALVTSLSQPGLLASSRVSQCVAVMPGRQYAFGASIWLAGWDSDVLPTPNPIEVRISVKWFPDASCMTVAGAPSESQVTPVIGSTWMDVQGSVTAPASAVAALVVIGASAAFPGVTISIYVDDAYLVGNTTCIPTDSDLCLSQGRFRVSGSWRIPDRSRSGYMRALPVAGDSGLFWFFSPDNMEIMVKVLNACAEPAGRFWVFAAGTTNLETFLLVEDTTAAFTLRTYANPFGTPFVPIQDTAAFTCP